MIDIKQWLEMRRNRRKLLHIFPGAAIALVFYIVVGSLTSFLFITVVYGLILALLAVIGGIAFAYIYIEEWVDEGRL